MAAIRMSKLSEDVGVEVLDVDTDRLREDEDLPGAVHHALEEHGVVLFRELSPTDAQQAEFCSRLGRTAKFPRYPNPDVMEISFDPGNPNAEYFLSNDYWHIDGALDDIPAKASVLTAHVTAKTGGETEFASTYAAYDALSAAEQEQFERLRVIHTFAAIQSLTYPDPTPEQRTEWASRIIREHPLVWTHQTGRRSLVFGATADFVIGMSLADGRALLAELQSRATAPDRVYRHDWSVGDMVLWDNRGLVHRACAFDRSEPRSMHRSTLVGDEPIS